MSYKYEGGTKPGRLLIFEPGNGSRYVLSFTPLSDETCQALGCQRGSTLVTWVSEEGHSYPFAPGGHLATSYVHEKLGGSEADAEALTRAICEVLGRSFRTLRLLDKQPHV